MTQIQEKLFELADCEYKKFHKRLVPTLDEAVIIGVRTPMLRKFAKELSKDEAENFLKVLPHTYYEENNLHAFILEKIVDFNIAVSETERFLPYIDNWATCDSFMPHAFKKEKDKLLPYIMKWIESGKTYHVRYGTELLMKLYLDDDFDESFLDVVANINSKEYYVNMMSAWYFATALCKQYKSAVRYLEDKKLPLWVHNKTIQKATESYRITAEQKAYLKMLKIKK